MEQQQNSLWNSITSSLYFIYSIFTSFISSCAPSPTLTVNSKKYKIIKQLGEGGFSYVYLVKETQTLAQFAIKRIRVQLPEHEPLLKKEIKHQKNIISDNVLKLVDSQLVIENGKIIEGLLLLPFYNGGTLQDLVDCSVVDIPLLRVLKIGIDICKGLEAFHCKSLAFRDLKPANILLECPSSNDVKAILMDLGSVETARVEIASRKEALALIELASETCTAPFRAPELFDPSTGSTVTEKSDIWSLGCTMYFLIYRSTPFDGTHSSCISAIKFPNSPSYDSRLIEIVRSMLVIDSELRPTVFELRRSLENLHSQSQGAQEV